MITKGKPSTKNPSPVRVTRGTEERGLRYLHQTMSIVKFFLKQSNIYQAYLSDYNWLYCLNPPPKYSHKPQKAKNHLEE